MPTFGRVAVAITLQRAGASGYRPGSSRQAPPFKLCHGALARLDVPRSLPTRPRDQWLSPSLSLGLSCISINMNSTHSLSVLCAFFLDSVPNLTPPLRLTLSLLGLAVALTCRWAMFFFDHGHKRTRRRLPGLRRSSNSATIRSYQIRCPLALLRHHCPTESQAQASLRQGHEILSILVLGFLKCRMPA